MTGRIRTKSKNSMLFFFLTIVKSFLVFVVFFIALIESLPFVHASDVVISSSSTVPARMIRVTIVVPEDWKQYDDAIVSFMDEDPVVGRKRINTLPYIKKTIEVFIPASIDIVRASAEAAAQEGVKHRAKGGKIIYLEIQHGTAYVVLDIDVDGWAGVSYSKYYIRTLVERTLLQSKHIGKVIWGAPDKETLKRIEQQYLLEQEYLELNNAEMVH